jgi:hypothetical protein
MAHSMHLSAACDTAEPQSLTPKFSKAWLKAYCLLLRLIHEARKALRNSSNWLAFSLQIQKTVKQALVNLILYSSVIKKKA